MGQVIFTKDEKELCGAHVRSLRESRGLLGNQLAKLSGVFPARISALEKGNKLGLEDDFLEKTFYHLEGGNPYLYLLSIKLKTAMQKKGLVAIDLARAAGLTLGSVETLLSATSTAIPAAIGKILDILDLQKDGKELVQRSLGLEQKDLTSAQEAQILANRNEEARKKLVEMRATACSMLIIDSTALHDIECTTKQFQELVNALQNGYRRWYFVPLNEWNRYGDNLLERLELYVSKKTLGKLLRVYGVASEFFSRTHTSYYLSPDFRPSKKDTKGAGIRIEENKATLLLRYSAGAIMNYLEDIAREIEERTTPENRNRLVIECIHRLY